MHTIRKTAKYASLGKLTPSLVQSRHFCGVYFSFQRVANTPNAMKTPANTATTAKLNMMVSGNFVIIVAFSPSEK